MPRLSQTLQNPSFKQAQSALIGQLAQCIVIGRTPQARIRNVTPLTIIASFKVNINTVNNVVSFTTSSSPRGEQSRMTDGVYGCVRHRDDACICSTLFPLSLSHTHTHTHTPLWNSCTSRACKVGCNRSAWSSAFSGYDNWTANNMNCLNSCTWQTQNASLIIFSSSVISREQRMLCL